MSDLSYLIDEFRKNIKKWEDGWISESSRNSINVEVSTEISFLDKNTTLQHKVYRKAGGDVHVFNLPEVFEALLAKILNVNPDDIYLSDSSVSVQVQNIFIIDLINCFCLDNESGSFLLNDPNFGFNYDYKPGSGDVLVKVLVDDMPIYLVIPFKFVNEFFISDRSRSFIGPKLGDRNNQEIRKKLKISVLAGMSELSFSTIENLSIGDVIKLKNKIDEPLKVYTKDQQYICDAYLGKRNSLKAAKVIIKN